MGWIRKRREDTNGRGMERMTRSTIAHLLFLVLLLSTLAWFITRGIRRQPDPATSHPAIEAREVLPSPLGLRGSTGKSSTNGCRPG